VSPQHLLVILSKKFHVLVDSKKFHVLVSLDFGYLDFGPRRSSSQVIIIVVQKWVPLMFF